MGSEVRVGLLHIPPLSRTQGEGPAPLLDIAVFAAEEKEVMLETHDDS